MVKAESVVRRAPEGFGSMSLIVKLPIAIDSEEQWKCVSDSIAKDKNVPPSYEELHRSIQEMMEAFPGSNNRNLCLCKSNDTCYVQITFRFPRLAKLEGFVKKVGLALGEELNFRKKTS